MPFQVVDARAADGDLAVNHARGSGLPSTRLRPRSLRAGGIRGLGFGIRMTSATRRSAPHVPCPMPHAPYRLFQPSPKHEILPRGGAIIGAPRCGPPGASLRGLWMSRAVGRNVVRKDGAAKAAGTARYVDDLTRPGLLYARTIRSSIPCGDDRRPSPRLRHRGVHHRRRPRHPRPQRRVAHHRRPAVPGRRPGPPRRRAHPAAGPRGSGAPAGGQGRDRLPARKRRCSTRSGRTGCSSTSPSPRAMSTRACAAPTSSSKASTGPATRSTSTSSPTACWPSRKTGASRSWARCSARTTCIARWPCCSACRSTGCAWCRPKRAADSAARRSIRR